MAIEIHIQQLEAKHKELDMELTELLLQPGSPSEKIADMKRRKLHLKDRISKLRGNNSLH